MANRLLQLHLGDQEDLAISGVILARHLSLQQHKHPASDEDEHLPAPVSCQCLRGRRADCRRVVHLQLPRGRCLVSGQDRFSLYHPTVPRWTAAHPLKRD